MILADDRSWVENDPGISEVGKKWVFQQMRWNYNRGPSLRLGMGCMRQVRRGYTLVELIVIILMIAIGTTLILSVHTKLQRDALDMKDADRFQYFQQQFTLYSDQFSGRFPAVEAFVSEADRVNRISDYRQRPAKALRILFRYLNKDLNSEREALRSLYSPLDGDIPEVLLENMSKNTALTTKDSMCFSSYSYDPGHVRGGNKNSGDGKTVIFGHSPAFLLQHGRNSVRVLRADLSMDTIYRDNKSNTYEIPVRFGGANPKVIQDDIYQDQAAELYNFDSYLSDEIPFAP